MRAEAASDALSLPVPPTTVSVFVVTFPAGSVAWREIVFLPAVMPTASSKVPSVFASPLIRWPVVSLRARRLLLPCVFPITRAAVR